MLTDTHCRAAKPLEKDYCYRGFYMKHYLLPDGKILDLFKDGSQDHLITDEMTLLEMKL